VVRVISGSGLRSLCPTVYRWRERGSDSHVYVRVAGRPSSGPRADRRSTGQVKATAAADRPSGRGTNGLSFPLSLQSVTKSISPALLDRRRRAGGKVETQKSPRGRSSKVILKVKSENLRLYLARVQSMTKWRRSLPNKSPWSRSPQGDSRSNAKWL